MVASDKLNSFMLLLHSPLGVIRPAIYAEMPVQLKLPDYPHTFSITKSQIQLAVQQCSFPQHFVT